jgi:hypothetical protein
MRPVREIPIQSLSVGGRFPSRKNKRMVSYESQLELAFLYHLEFSSEVKEYVEQPCKVKSPAGKFYIPDFLVFFSDPLRKPLLVEIKYLRDVKRNLDKMLTKLETLEKFACEKGYDFKLFTDKELLTERLKNYRFLYGYLSPPISGSDYLEFTQNVVNLVKREQPIRVIDIANVLGKGNFTLKGLYLSTVWHLIATSVLWVNFDEELTNHSFVYTTKPIEVEERCLL